MQISLPSSMKLRPLVLIPTTPFSLSVTQDNSHSSPQKALRKYPEEVTNIQKMSVGEEILFSSILYVQQQEEHTHLPPRACLCIPYAEEGIMLFMGIDPLFSNVYPFHSIRASSSAQSSLQSHDKTLHLTKALFHPSSRRSLF